MLNKIPNPFRTRFFSAWGFAFRALLILGIFAVFHLSGCREYTSFITGTTSGNLYDVLGMAYFLFYMLTVFVAPLLLIGAMWMVVLSRVAGVED